MSARAVVLQIAASALEDVLGEADYLFLYRVRKANYPLVTTSTFIKLVEEELTDFVVEIRKGIDRLDSDEERIEEFHTEFMLCLACGEKIE